MDVAGAFYGYLRQKRDLAIIGEILTLFQERVRELEEREKVGRSRLSELIRAKARMKIFEAEEAELRGAVGIAQALLEFLMAVELGGREVIDEELPQNSLSDLAEYLGRVEKRPDVEAAKQGMKTAWRGVIVEQSGGKPTGPTTV